MKYLNKTHRAQLMLAVLLLFFSACKKNDSTPQPKKSDTTKTTPVDTTTTPVGVTGCKLTQEYYKGSSNTPLLYKFEYDANGNPSKITSYNNGVLGRVETVQPDNMVFKEGTSTALYLGIKYDTKYLDKQPGIYKISTASANDWIIGLFTYDAKGRLSTVTGGYSENGVFSGTAATTATFFYDDNNDVSKITYTYMGKVVKTYTAKGYDNHPTPFHNIKNSWFLQHDFMVFSTDYDQMRYMFERQSTHNLLGFNYVEAGETSYYTEDYKYVYDDKGQPTERQAATSRDGQTSAGGFIDNWTYECK